MSEKIFELDRLDCSTTGGVEDLRIVVGSADLREVDPRAERRYGHVWDV